MGKKKQESKLSREARIKKICGAINQGTYGGEQHNAVTWLGSRDVMSIERFSTGCPDLDDALGGGWPKARMGEIFGPESGGKTTLVKHAIAEYQKMWPDDDVGFIDSEYAFDEEYAKAIGVDTKYLIVHQPESGKQALNVMDELIKANVGLLVVDSVAALLTEEDITGELGNVQMGSQARMMSQSLRRLNADAGQRGCTILWTNQLREKIGVMFGDPTITPAGRALKHYASVRVHIRRTATVKEGPKDAAIAVSNKTKADVRKNKTAPPFRSATFYITYGYGIDKIAAILDPALALKVIKKRGSWLSFGDEQIAQGRKKSMDRMREDEDLAQRIQNAVEEAKASGKKEEPPEESSNVEQEASEASVDPDAIDSPAEEVKVEDV